MIYARLREVDDQKRDQLNLETGLLLNICSAETTALNHTESETSLARSSGDHERHKFWPLSATPPAS